MNSSTRRTSSVHPAVFPFVLVLINYLVFVYLKWITSADLEAIVHSWAFSPDQVFEMLDSFDLFAAVLLILRSMFTHFNQSHLLANVIPIYLLGIVIARQNGPGEFLITYLIGGFLAAALVVILSPALSASLPIIGASGSGAALYGFYLFDRVKSASGKEKLYVFVLPLTLSVFFITGRFYGLEAELLPRVFQWLIMLSFIAGVLFRPRQWFWVTAICLWTIANIYNLACTMSGIYTTGSAHLLHICGVLAGILLSYLTSIGKTSSKSRCTYGSI